MEGSSSKGRGRQIGEYEHLVVETVARQIESVPGMIITAGLSFVVGSVLTTLGFGTALTFQALAYTSPVIGSLVGTYINASDSAGTFKNRVTRLLGYSDISVYVDPFIRKSRDGRFKLVKNVDSKLKKTYFNRSTQAKRRLEEIVRLMNAGNGVDQERILENIDTLKAIYWEMTSVYGKARRRYGKGKSRKRKMKRRFFSRF